MTHRQLFLDLDGVLADFDSGYEKLFGHRPDRDKGDPPDLWQRINGHGAFYYALDLMPDALELFEFAEPHRPVILTGVNDKCPGAEADKRAMVRKHFGTRTPVITCRSRDKSLAARPGDVLVDDWLRYRDLWIQAGGVWVTHRSAAETIAALRDLGFSG